MKTKKDNYIKKLNEEILFHSRKNFGMLGNIQWSVKNFIKDVLFVEVSSSNVNWGKKLPDGHTFPPKEKILDNIKKSILHFLPEAKIKIKWVKYDPNIHGRGVIISVRNKDINEATKEIYNKLK
jgi:hypothetical protein